MTPQHEPNETSIADAAVARAIRQPGTSPYEPRKIAAEGEPLRLADRAVSFFAVAGQLALVLLVVYLLGVEEKRYFFPLMCLVCGGFVVHAWLPARWRLGFFCLLSLLWLALFLDWPDAAWVVGIGAGLIALCHLPVPRLLRAVLILGIGVWLAAFRVNYPFAPFWPVLASMFMFRLMLYLYELRPGSPRPSLGQTIAYFFPLPNVIFPLFPVIDFRTFRETYHSGADYSVYQSGVAWIVRGLMHLLAYRFVKHYLLPAQVDDVDDLALFLAANYALYLHVSACFHLITGILHLFGFNLPRTHDNYFLASSFSDIWRRINIYWKDFLTKLFFFPAVFTLRRLGTRTAMTLAALWVFLWTWLLHSYQTFWLLGNLSLTWREGGLWLLVGILAAINLQLDLRKARRPAQESSVLRATLGLSVRVVGMFVLVSIFWALWMVPNHLGRYLAHVTEHASVAGGLRVGGVLLVAVLLGTVGQLLWRQLAGRVVLPAARSWPGSVAVHTAVLAALVLLSLLPAVGDVRDTEAGRMIATLSSEALTAAETEQALLGYYGELDSVALQPGSLLDELMGKKRKSRPPDYLQMSEVPKDPRDRAFLERVLIPGWSGEIAGSWLTINDLGMRDREGLTKKKPAGTRRIALVGSSGVMGYGVGDDEVFGRLMEKELNATAAEGSARLEVLNFGAGRCYAIHRRFLVDRKVFDFEPDAIYYFAHQDERFFLQHLVQLVVNRHKLPYRCLDEVVGKANIQSDDTPGQIQGKLEQFTSEILGGIYLDLAEACRRRKITPVWIYLPMPLDVPSSMRASPSKLIELATASKFEVIDLSAWKGNHTPLELNVDPFHPNALGHRLIAEHLLRELRARPNWYRGDASPTQLIWQVVGQALSPAPYRRDAGSTSPISWVEHWSEFLTSSLRFHGA